ncbi:MAG: YidC/Oxa1 family membrane protein insertase [Bacilli bacterium]
MKKNKSKLIVLLLIVTLLTGCTKTLKGSDKKVVTNPETGQSLTENILCRPIDEKTMELYKNNGVDISKVPTCDNFTPTSGGYEGLWANIFVKPLAFLILWISKFVGSAALSLIITTLLIRLVAYPLTNKTAMQSELIKKAQPDLDRLEKKYKDKTDQDSLMKKSQEMTMIYKKNNINPLSGCLFGLIQLPLFFAFLEAINRIPAVFEENFLTLQMGTTPWIGIFTRGNWFYLILVVLIGITTYFSMNLNKTATTNENDPMKSMSNIMTIMILIMSFFMPAALGIYWIASNAFTIIQNLIVKRSKKLNG